LHRCDVPACVRPDHLFLGTLSDNRHDAVAKERQARGSRQHLAKLTESQVAVMRIAPRRRGDLQHWATRYGISMSTVKKILDRETWRHVQ
jgi:hypothetical protein